MLRFQHAGCEAGVQIQPFMKPTDYPTIVRLACPARGGGWKKTPNISLAQLGTTTLSITTRGFVYGPPPTSHHPPPVPPA